MQAKKCLSHVPMAATPPNKGVKDDQDGMTLLNTSRMSSTILATSKYKFALVIALNLRTH